MRRVISQGLPVALLGVAACLLVLPSGALASNHLIKIREVYAGSVTNPNSEYVELQMYAAGQNFLANAISLKLYDASGNVTSTFAPVTMDGNPPMSQSQRRVLVASQEAKTEFHVSAGYTLAPGDHISDAGGAVCYLPSTPGFADCVSWGTFDNTSGTALPSATGGNVDSPGGIGDTHGIQRSIAPGCATLLEAGDDTNNPADWSEVFPVPLNNASPPPEIPCPNTTLTKKPKARTTDRTPTFKFTSTINPATFECNLDGAGFSTCESPLTSRKLSFGKHTFKVRASANGATDPTPARASFRVVKNL